MTHQGKEWVDIHEVQPKVEISADTLAVKNIRKVSYTGKEEFDNYTFEFFDKTYKLSELKKVWFFENNYAKFQSHIMLSFEFAGGSFLTVSVEVRKRNLKDFEVWHVLTKSFNIFYILSVEEDIVYLRTNIRKSPINMYELKLSPEQQKCLLLEISHSINRTYDNNAEYKVLRTDCVSTLLANFRNVQIPVIKYFWDWSPTRVLFRSGLIKTKCVSADEVYATTIINEKAAPLEQNSYYSIGIRDGRV